jgi:hypothetical protein
MTLALPISDTTIWSIPYDRKTFIVQVTDACTIKLFTAVIVAVS